MLDRTKDVIVIEVDQGLKFPGNDHLKQTILDEALEGRLILINIMSKHKHYREFHWFGEN